MIREEFKLKLSEDIEENLDKALWICDSNDCMGETCPDGIIRITEIAVEAAELLFKKIEKLNTEKKKLVALLDESQSDCTRLVLDLEIAERRVRDLIKALEFYSNKDNLERYIRSVERHRPDDPDYRYTEIILHDEVTKIAEESLNK